jgi:hypothetical protein
MRTLKLTGITAAILVAATLVWAQQAPKPAAPSQAQGRYSMMNGGHYRGMHAVMEKLQAAITRARDSRDPAQQKAALDQAQSQLSTLEQMTSCPMAEGRGMMGSAVMRGSMMGRSQQTMPMNGMYGDGNQPATR